MRKVIYWPFAFNPYSKSGPLAGSEGQRSLVHLIWAEILPLRIQEPPKSHIAWKFMLFMRKVRFWLFLIGFNLKIGTSNWSRRSMQPDTFNLSWEINSADARAPWKSYCPCILHRNLCGIWEKLGFGLFYLIWHLNRAVRPVQTVNATWYI